MLRSRKRAGGVAVSALLCGMILSARSAGAQDVSGRIDALQQLNGSVESLVKRVAQSVVQVIVTSYGPVERGDGAETDGEGRSVDLVDAAHGQPEANEEVVFILCGRLDEVDLVIAADHPLDDLGRGINLAVDQENRTGEVQAHLHRHGVLRPCGPAGQQPENYQSIQSF